MTRHEEEAKQRPQTDGNKTSHWRFGVDPFWEHVCSMYQECYMYRHATHAFARNHHLRSCVYFCVSALEAGLNQKMRAFLEKEHTTEFEIIKKLKNEKLSVKIKKWPEMMNGLITNLPQYVPEHFDEMINLRHEITHSKNKDHAIYLGLEEVNPFWCVKSASEYLVALHEALKEEYPYWLLGWNIVGQNHECQAFCGNNGEFVWGLSNIGFNISAGDYSRSMRWREENMTTLSGYQKLSELLRRNTLDIEPRNPIFPTKTRLTRRWWDEALIKAP